MGKLDLTSILNQRIYSILINLTEDQRFDLLALTRDELLARLVGGTSQASAPPQITLVLGDREYEVVPFLESGETTIDGEELVRRAERLEANLGQEDGQFILDNQSNIQVEIRGRVTLVFAAWHNPERPHQVVIATWLCEKWLRSWGDLVYESWGKDDRLVRRRLPAGQSGK